MHTLSPPFRTLLLAAAALSVGRHAAAQAVWPAGPSTYANDATTLVVLPNQQAAPGLTDGQVADLRELSRNWLDQVHDVRGDLRALREAVHTVLGAQGPDGPADPGEAMALFADIDSHEAEVRAVFQEGAGAALALLTDDQRALWERTLARAMEDAGGPAHAPP